MNNDNGVEHPEKLTVLIEKYKKMQKMLFYNFFNYEYNEEKTPFIVKWIHLCQN